MKRLLLLCMALILSHGCASNTLVKPDESTENLMASEMAYVLVGYSGYVYSLWQHTSLHYSDKPEKNQRAEFDGKLFSKPDYFLIELVPGNYTLVDFIHTTNDYSYYMNESAKQMNEQLKNNGGLIGSFKAEQGKITYIGDLEMVLNTFAQHASLFVKNNQADALEFLNTKYPGIDAERLLQTKLAHRGPGG